MKHNDIAIAIVINQLEERSMKPSTPKRLAGLMFEAAEIIRQLRRERDRAQELAVELEKVKKERDAVVGCCMLASDMSRNKEEQKNGT